MEINDYSNYGDLTDLLNKTGELNDIVNSGSQEARKSQLKKLFTKSYFNDSAEKANIEAQIKNLEAKIAQYEGKVEELEKEIGGKQEEITKISNQIVDQIDKIARKTGEFERTNKAQIQEAMDLAIYHFYNDSHSRRNGGEKTMLDFINEQMTGVMSGVYTDQAELKNMIGELAVPQNKVKTFAQELEDKIGDVDNLEAQYTTTKATLELLKLTSKSIADSSKSYIVSETSSQAPILIPAKAELANDYLAQYTSRLSNTGTPATATSTMTKDEAYAKWNEQIGDVPQYTGSNSDSQKYSQNNPQLVKFSEALNGGLIQDMHAAGISNEEIVNYIKDKFPSIGIYNSNGKVVIPNGYDAGKGWGNKSGFAGGTYDKFKTQLNSSVTVEKEVGNVAQITEMGKAVSGKNSIITEMKNEDFTWKECAHTLTKLWPESGIQYKLGEKKITIPVGTGNSKSAYDALASEIKKNYPDVEIIRPSSTETIGGGNTSSIKRSDPVGFTAGNSSFEFVIDRDNDNKFSNFNEMVGANGIDGMEELKSFDTNNDGKLEGDELNKLLVFNVDHAETKNDKTDIEFMSAAQLGITSIDLNSFEQADQNNNIDINNSKVIGNFDIKLDTNKFENKTGLDASGNITGYQKEVDDTYKEAVYNPLLGNNIAIDLTDEQVEKIINGSFDIENSDLADLVELKKLLHQQWLLKGDLKTALDNKVDNILNEIIGFKTSKTSEAIGLSLTADKIDTIYTNEEADTVTANHLDNAEDEAYGQKIKEELIKDGIINPLYQDED